jgi:hypothetical protein
LTVCNTVAAAERNTPFGASGIVAGRRMDPDVAPRTALCLMSEMVIIFVPHSYSA